MGLFNSSDGYGAATKLLHWIFVVVFALQYISANIMMRLAPDGLSLGLTQAAYYNWHKSIGLIALALAVVRLIARRAGELPPWAPTLSERERAFIHRAEQAAYAAMFVMPVSGFVYVMAGGYGVRLFGLHELPNPIGEWPLLAAVSKWMHVAASFALLAVLAGHAGLVLRHQLILRDKLLWRMLPKPRGDRRG